MAVRTWRYVAPALVVIALGACGGDDEPTVGDALTSDSTTSTTPAAPADDVTTSTTIEVTVNGGSVDGGIRTEKVKIGDTVRLRVTSDENDEVHVHGYDKEFEVGPGKPGEVTFDATIPGVFEVEMHHTGKEILKLEVSP